MNWFERQKKLRKMLLTVISSSNLRKTYDVDVFNPEKRKRKWLRCNKNNRLCPTKWGMQTDQPLLPLFPIKISTPLTHHINNGKVVGLWQNVNFLHQYE